MRMGSIHFLLVYLCFDIRAARCVFHNKVMSFLSFIDSGHPGVWVPRSSVSCTERLQRNVPGLWHLRPRRNDFLAHQLSCLFPCEFNQWIRNSWMMLTQKTYIGCTEMYRIYHSKNWLFYRCTQWYLFYLGQVWRKGGLFHVSISNGWWIL